MQSRKYPTIHDIYMVLSRKTVLRWLCVFLSAGLLVSLTLYFFKYHLTVTAQVSFNYNGIEAGLDPLGNRFDVQEMKTDFLIQKTAEAVGLSNSKEDVKRIQAAIEISSVIPDAIFESITSYQSIYGEDGIDAVKQEREASYYPSQYSLIIHYARAGISVREAKQFLSQLLNNYEHYFYERYGYSRTLEESISSIEYEGYDYINTVEVMDNRLMSLRTYLEYLSNLDNTRFNSTITGLSFSDLIQSIDSIRSSDISWITSYIVSNNITKNRSELIDYYRYKIEDAGRELDQHQSRLYTLSTQIEGYVKTSAIFLGLVDGGSTEQETAQANYEFPQQSAMYDALINEKVKCETSISETQEQISLYERRIKQLESTETVGSPDFVEDNLTKIDDKVNTLLDNTRETSDEFFKTVFLKRAVQIVKEPENPFSITRIFLSSLHMIIYVEATLLGVFVLVTLNSACDIARKGNTTMNRKQGGRLQNE